ncbi:helix-turn-helix domain-containing protein [Pseudomonas entomophila]|uniref:helix-turn-helix domain-containing protein n=1 Tax=Pseudomonas entomophila TaxID=312306 RepID=UPI001F0245BD|nr:helix-turn-helix transcriptional regulator [Pseudomonas entomophila]MCG8291974.1 helix-turn-helix transcriptional regulator [Pseudomonas entomophila]
MTTDFAINLIRLRGEKNLTQQELGDAIGVSPSQISRYEAGQAKPRKTVLRKLAETLGVEAEELSGAQRGTSGREISFNISEEDEAKIQEFAKRKGLSFNAAVQLILVQGLKDKLDADKSMLAKLEQDIPGAYEKLVELLKKN